MNDLFGSLGNQLKGTSGGTKLIAVMVGLGLIVVVGVAAVVSYRPDYQLTFSGLTDHEFPRVTKALSEGGISFRTSQPPAPFSVFVDERDRSAAYRAAYGAGALDKPLRGIMTDAGMASLFSSNAERRQGVRKREWGEMELMLEELDYVLSAKVRTSPAPESPFAARTAPPVTASVTLRVAGNDQLTRTQADTVAHLVSRGLGVGREMIVISDQSGISLFDGNLSRDEDRQIEALLDYQGTYDRNLTEVANTVLADVLGDRKARVTVTSDWDFAQSTTSIEQATGEGALVKEVKNKTDRTMPAAVPEPVGVSANTVDPSAPGAPGDRTTGGEPMTENTTDETREYVPTISREDKVDSAPRLQRLSVALFLDQSLEGTEVKLEDLEGAIKASVGFQENRDEFQSVIFPFAGSEAGEAAASTPAVEEAPAEPSPMMETLLERGLEILTGIVFLTLLLRSMKRSKAPENAVQPEPARGAPAAGRAQALGTPNAEADQELAARLQVEQLLDSDPDKVGEILSSWVREDELAEANQ